MLKNLINIRALRIVIHYLLVFYYFNKETADCKFKLAYLLLEAIKALQYRTLIIYIAFSRRRAYTLIIPSYFINSILITFLEKRVSWTLVAYTTECVD